MNYWLLKSEPTDYSIEDLQQDRQAVWDGVRNYQARNFLRQMQRNDYAFFYHSNCKPPGIVGLSRIIQANVDDPTQFDPNSKYYDPKSTRESPRWQTVEIEFIKTFPHAISLEILKKTFTSEDIAVVKKGNRLSVMPVPETVAETILGVADLKHEW